MHSKVTPPYSSPGPHSLVAGENVGAVFEILLPTKDFNSSLSLDLSLQSLNLKISLFFIFKGFVSIESREFLGFPIEPSGNVNAADREDGSPPHQVQGGDGLGGGPATAGGRHGGDPQEQAGGESTEEAEGGNASACIPAVGPGVGGRHKGDSSDPSFSLLDRGGLVWGLGFLVFFRVWDCLFFHFD